MKGWSYFFAILKVYILTTIVTVEAFPSDKNYWNVCNNKNAQGTSIPFSGTLKKHTFLSNCAPEILYSWQYFTNEDEKKFEGHPFSEYPKLYTWRTPLGTFGYGTTQVRIKLRPGVTFKWVGDSPNCRNIPAKEKDNTVYVNLPTDGSSLSDYVLCSPEVVASWSRNTQGANLEAQKELAFIKKNMNGKVQSYDAYGGFNKNRIPNEKEIVLDGEINPYFPTVLDSGTDWTMKRFLENLKGLAEGRKKADGIIFFNKNIEQDFGSHFNTKIKSYFSLSDEEIQSL